MKITLVDKHEAADILCITQWTVRAWRKQGKLIEGVHYIWMSCRCVRYIKEALENLILHGNNPEAHEAWCHEFLAKKEQLKKKVV